VNPKTPWRRFTMIAAEREDLLDWLSTQSKLKKVSLKDYCYGKDGNFYQDIYFTDKKRLVDVEAAMKHTDFRVLIDTNSKTRGRQFGEEAEAIAAAANANESSSPSQEKQYSSNEKKPVTTKKQQNLLVESQSTVVVAAAADLTASDDALKLNEEKVFLAADHATRTNPEKRFGIKQQQNKQCNSRREEKEESREREKSGRKVNDSERRNKAQQQEQEITTRWKEEDTHTKEITTLMRDDNMGFSTEKEGAVVKVLRYASEKEKDNWEQIGHV